MMLTCQKMTRFSSYNVFFLGWGDGIFTPPQRFYNDETICGGVGGADGYLISTPPPPEIPYFIYSFILYGGVGGLKVS